MDEPPADVRAFLLEHPSLRLEPSTGKVRGAGAPGCPRDPLSPPRESPPDRPTLPPAGEVRSNGPRTAMSPARAPGLHKRQEVPAAGRRLPGLRLRQVRAAHRAQHQEPVRGRRRPGTARGSRGGGDGFSPSPAAAGRWTPIPPPAPRASAPPARGGSPRPPSQELGDLRCGWGSWSCDSPGVLGETRFC